MSVPFHERNLPTMQSAPDRITVFDGREMIYFGGTGYLGLQAAPEMIDAGCRGAREWGIAAATSRARLGNNAPTLAVERAAADFFRTDDAFYLQSGFFGPAVIATACAAEFDTILIDEAAHYAVRDAAERASAIGPSARRFAHCDVRAVEDAVDESPKGHRFLVMSDGVFPAEGAIAPVVAYLDAVASRPGSAVFIDDAHGVGVLGSSGLGTREHHGLLGFPSNTTHEHPVRLFWTATLSKAFGGIGGVVAGESGFIDRLKSTSRLYDGASQPSSFDAGVSRHGIEIVQNRPELRSRLLTNVRLLRSRLRGIGIETGDSPVPIVAFRIGGREQMTRIHAELWEEGICLPYLSSYSGTDANGVLRATVFSTHTEADIERLTEVLSKKK